MAITALVVLVAIEHMYFLYLEMFAWTQKRTRRAFGTTEEFAVATKSLAANQGLYNGFLAAGLVWGIVYPVAAVGLHIQSFFLICVVVAAIYGGFSVKRSILYIQGGPAIVALAGVLLR